jgi:hypothetical protein
MSERVDRKSQQTRYNLAKLWFLDGVPIGKIAQDLHFAEDVVRSWSNDWLLTARRDEMPVATPVALSLTTNKESVSRLVNKMMVLVDEGIDNLARVPADMRSMPVNEMAVIVKMCHELYTLASLTDDNARPRTRRLSTLQTPQDIEAALRKIDPLSKGYDDEGF